MIPQFRYLGNRVFTCITNMRRPRGETVFPGVFNVMHSNRVDIFGNLLDLYNLENMKALKSSVIITKALKHRTRTFTLG